MNAIRHLLRTALLFLSLHAAAFSQNLDPGFNFSPVTLGGRPIYSLKSVSMQPDGKILWVGSFVEPLGGTTQYLLLRLNTDGSPDHSFTSPAANGYVYSVAVQTDGKILLGGSFTAMGGVARNRIARLNPDGSLDPDFNPNSSNYVYSIALQDDGKILIGGGFTSIAGITRTRVARLNPDGTLDLEFNPNANNAVYLLTPQEDGKILLGGNFTTINGSVRNQFARLNADGTLDSVFDPNVSVRPDCIAPLPNGKVLIGGYFTSVGGVARSNLAQLNADGSLDLTFNPNVNNRVQAIAVHADGKIGIGGSFTTVGGLDRSTFARLLPSGTLDSWEMEYSVGSALGGTDKQIFPQVDGSILCRGGEKIIRLTDDTAPAASLTVSGSGQIDWLIGGSGPELRRVIFETWNGSAWISQGLATRVAGGWRKSGLTLPATSWVRASGATLTATLYGNTGAVSQVSPFGPGKFPQMVVAREDGKAIASGATTIDFGTLDWSTMGSAKSFTITNAGDATLSGLSLSISGANAADFTPSLLTTTSLAPGASTTFTLRFSPLGSSTGTATLSLASNDVAKSPFSFNLQGNSNQRDGNFSVITNDGNNATVDRIVMQGDGEILISGDFQIVNGVRRNSFARLRKDGELDLSFNPSVGRTRSIALQRDGKILVYVGLPAVNGVPQGKVARLHADGTMDLSFVAADSAGTVSSFAVQDDGRILIGGGLSDIGGVVRNNIARLNQDGSLDTTFNPNINGYVQCLAIQSDGKILVGGSFTTIGGVARNNIGRLNADGALDTTFNPNANSTVNSFACQPDGKILVAGVFTSIGGTVRNYFARLHADGTVETAFNPVLSRSVSCIVLQADGKILLNTSNSGTVGGVARNGIARLNANGSLDPFFNPDVYGNISSIAQQADGRILIGGGFTNVSGVSQKRMARLLNDSPASQELAITAEGQIDWLRGGAAPELTQVSFSSWDGNAWIEHGAAVRIAGGWRKTGLPLTAQNLYLRAQGRLNNGNGDVASGILSQTVAIGTASRPDISVAVAEGSVLASNDDVVDFGPVSYLAPVSSKIFTITNAGDAPLSGLGLSVSGAGAADFAPGVLSTTSLEPGSSTSFTVQFSPQAGGVRAARLLIASNDADELPFTVNLAADFVQHDAGFNPAGINYVYSTVPLPDGKTLVGGGFTTISGVVRNYIARLNPDGTPDPHFNPNANGPVQAIAVQTDGKIVIGGYFTMIGGVPRNRLARLNADGTLDASFNPNLDGNPGDRVSAESLALQADGKILVGGWFRKVGTVNRTNIARLNVDGSLDTTFNFALTAVYAIAIQQDGRILVGGSSNTTSLFRLSSTGTVDSSFNPNIPGYIQSLAVQQDGKILVGGGFSTVGTVSRNYIARLTTTGALDPVFNPNANSTVHSFAQQADGKIVISGYFTTVGGVARARLARLHADGTVDLGFNPPASGDSGIALQADGQILMGASRLLNNTLPDQQLLTTGTHTINWLRGGSAPELEQVSFDVWNGSTWNSLGIATRIAGGWGKSSLSLPGNSTWVRARGRTTNSYSCGSSAIIEQISRTSFPDAPEISVSAGGDPFISGRNVVEFGSAAWFASGAAKTFTVTNAGSAPLSGLAVSMTAGDSADFSAGALGANTLAPGASTTFAVTFTPKGSARREATLSVISNDGDESPFTIQLTGTSVQQVTTYQPAADGWVSAIANQPNGKTLIGGSFTQINGVRRNLIARLNFDGSLDSSFSPNVTSQNGSVNVISVQADGKILVGGGNANFGGVRRRGIARLHSDGTLDLAFNPDASGLIRCILPLPDGKILVGGNFFGIGGISRNYFARLNSDGTVDTVFNPLVSAEVRSLALQSDGRILVGGTFSTVGGVTRSSVARLHADGSLDTSFTANPSSYVGSVAIQTDGKILVGGEFTSVAGVLRNGIARLHTDGALDLSFAPKLLKNPGSSSYPSAFSMLLQADGKILIAGFFDTVDGINRYNLARIHSNGALDLSFNPATNSSVLSLSQDLSGQVLIGGAFTTVEGVARNRIARIHNEPADAGELVNNQVNSITWARSGSVPEIDQVYFDAWNGNNWVTLGPGTRLAGGWRLSGIGTTASWLRAWGRTAGGGSGNGSSGIVEIIDVGVIGAPRPALEVRNPSGSPLYSNFSSVNFGSRPVGVATTQILTIRNSGDALLSNLAVSKAGVNAADFVLGNLSVTTLAPGATTALSITFQPGAAGAAHASVAIASSAAFKAPFEIALAGFGYLEPEMAIEHPLGINLLSGETHAFGDADIASNAAKVFTVRNTGSGDLDLGSILIDGAHAGDFVLTSAGTSDIVKPGATTTLLIIFSPSASGARSASLMITGNDPDEGNFVLSLTGTGREETLPPGAWVATGSLAIPRRDHTASRLQNGKVLVAGGRDTDELGLASAEIYDSVSGSWNPAGSMTGARYSHTATLLADGRLLVCGGIPEFSGGIGLAGAEIYDPVTGLWSVTASMSNARYSHTATLLPNGKVLVCGGRTDTFTSVAGSELFDPATGIWTSAGNLTTPRFFHTASLLSNGNVLVAGGATSSGGTEIANAEVFTIATSSWTPTSPLIGRKSRHTATVLPDGRVLVAGGTRDFTDQDEAEVYSPVQGTWNSTGTMIAACHRHAAALLADGQILVTGGVQAGMIATAQKYNPVTGSWSTFPSMNSPRGFHVLTVLANGIPMVTGGTSDSFDTLGSAEIYDPNNVGSEAAQLAFVQWSAMSSLTGPSAAPTATPFNDGVENLLKYAFNMNAAGPDVRVLATGGTAGLPQIAVDSSGAEPVLRVVFLRRKGSGLIYTPQRSTTLGNFVAITGTQTVTSIDAQWERVTVEEPEPPATAPSAFARVQVTLP